MQHLIAPFICRQARLILQLAWTLDRLAPDMPIDSVDGKWDKAPSGNHHVYDVISMYSGLPIAIEVLSAYRKKAGMSTSPYANDAFLKTVMRHHPPWKATAKTMEHRAGVLAFSTLAEAGYFPRRCVADKDGSPSYVHTYTTALQRGCISVKYPHQLPPQSPYGWPGADLLQGRDPALEPAIKRAQASAPSPSEPRCASWNFPFQDGLDVNARKWLSQLHNACSNHDLRTNYKGLLAKVGKKKPKVKPPRPIPDTLWSAKNTGPSAPIAKKIVQCFYEKLPSACCRRTNRRQGIWWALRRRGARVEHQAHAPTAAPGARGM